MFAKSKSFWCQFQLKFRLKFCCGRFGVGTINHFQNINLMSTSFLLYLNLINKSLFIEILSNYQISYQLCLKQQKLSHCWQFDYSYYSYCSYCSYCSYWQMEKMECFSVGNACLLITLTFPLDLYFSTVFLDFLISCFSLGLLKQC